MFFFFALIALLLLSGTAAMLLARKALARYIAWVPAIVVSGAGSIWSLRLLLAPAPLQSSHPWSIPFASLTFYIDSLAAFFLLVIFLAAAITSACALAYFRPVSGQRRTGLLYFSFNLLIAAMALVVTAANGILFLMAWEVMTFAAYFLILFDDDKTEVRRAGLIYLIAGHIGTAALFLLFWLLASHSGGSMEFSSFTAIKSASLLIQGTAGLLALIGFGVKAGIVPLHVWLPEAHPAAPSPVSALLSAVMIKTGIYGLLRLHLLLALPADWWAWSLIALGAVTGVLGIFYAMGQSDIKRLLAYSSIENIGIILLGLGIGSLGRSLAAPEMVWLGYGGALLHLLNHSLYKSLLFMGAGSIIHQLHEQNMERMGGVLKRMPWSGGFFILAAAAVCGLPPLNGFVSEFFIYLGAFAGISRSGPAGFFSALTTLIALALISGLALATFAKLIAVALLGAPRDPHIAAIRESRPAMLAPMAVTAALILLVGLAPALTLPLLRPVIAVVAGPDSVGPEMPAIQPLLLKISAAALLLIAVGSFLMLWRRRLVARRECRRSETWGCGYLAPDPSMQYTSASFADPFVAPFKAAAGVESRVEPPEGYFPAGQRLIRRVHEFFTLRLYTPLFTWIGLGLAQLQRIQHGRLPGYVLYITLMLILLLLWYGGVR